jgi:hypothetical protein
MVPLRDSRIVAAPHALGRFARQDVPQRGKRHLQQPPDARNRYGLARKGFSSSRE